MIDETNYLTKEQYEKFISSIDKLPMYNEEFIINHKFEKQDMKLLFQVIYEGAFRVSEALRLTPNDLILNERVIKLENTKGTKKSKQKREFGVVKDPTFDKLVVRSQYMKEDERFFPISRQTVWKWAKEIGQIAGIQLMHQNKDTTNMTIHTLRHSRAIHYVQANKPINIIQKKLRHRSLQPTTTYLSINIDSIKEIENDI